jgi:photosystem II stability/assembly factor-like uncharacterized protein
MNKYLRVILVLQFLIFSTRDSTIAQEWKKVSSPFGDVWAVVTTHHKTIIVGTGTGIILSTDRGNHWTSSNKGIIDKCVYSLARSGNIVFAGTRHGLYRSLDDGKSWIKTSLPDSSYRLLMTSPRGMVFTQIEDGELYSTTDNGSHWVCLNVSVSTGNKTTFNISQMIMDDSGNLLFPLDSCSLLKSTNNGINWERIVVEGFKNTREWLRIAARGNNIIVGTWQHGLMRSSDNGTTWEKLNPPKGNNLTVDYTNTGNVFLEMDEPYGKYESSDNGTTWYLINSPFRIVSSDRFDGDTIFAVARINDGRALVHSIDDGKSWNSLISSFDGAEVMEVSPIGELYVGTESCGAYKSKDYGTTWEAILDVRSIENIVFVNEHCIALGTSNSGVYISDGNGKIWNSATSHGLTDLCIHSLISAPKGTLLAGAIPQTIMTPPIPGSPFTHKGGGLWRSTDLGGSWSRVIHDNSYSTTNNGKTWVKYDSVWKQTMIDTVQPDFSINAMGIDPDGHICINANCDYKTGIYSSTNEGESWNKLKDIDRYDNVHTNFVKTACGEIFSGISRSTDNGKTFKDIVNGLSSSELNNLQALPNGDIIASTHYGLFYLPRGGNNWCCVGFKNIDVNGVTLNGKYLFVSLYYGYEDERNGVYRANLHDIQTLIPKDIVISDIWQEIGKPLDGKPRLFSIDRSGTIWLANDNGELARSTDQGIAWTTSKLPDEFIQSLITDTVDKTILLGSYGGFFQSKDNGETWEKTLYIKQNDKFRDPYVHSVFLDTDGTMFLGVSQRGPFRNPCADTSKKGMASISFGGSSYGRVYSQKRHTNKWIQSDSILPNEPTQILRNKKGILYVAVSGEGIYSSTDDGISWLECNNGLLSKDGFYMCNISAEIDRSVNYMTMDAKGTLYVIRASSQLYRLKSDCQSWEYVNALGGRGSSLIIDSHNILYIGTAAGVFRSEDNGNNWKPYSVGLSSSLIMGLMVHPNGHLFAMAEDGRVYKSIQRVGSN